MTAAPSALVRAREALAVRVMHDVGFTPRTTTLSALPAEMRRVLNASLAFGWGSPSVRLLMVVSLVEGAFVMWAFCAFQPYFL